MNKSFSSVLKVWHTYPSHKVRSYKMNWRLTKRKILSLYIKTVKKDKDLSLEQFFYPVFVYTTFKNSKNGNSDDNDERYAVASNEHHILFPKGMNCIPRYPVDYDCAQGMLILHKPWSKDNTLNSILSPSNNNQDYSTLLQVMYRQLETWHKMCLIQKLVLFIGLVLEWASIECWMVPLRNNKTHRGKRGLTA